MANNPFFADATAEAAANAAAAQVNSGFLEIYAGTQPTDANTAISGQTLLATLNLSSTAFGNAAASGTAPNRVATANANTIANGTGAATGTASWFRCYKSDGVSGAFDGTVGTSGCDLNLVSIDIVTGESVSVSSFSIGQPE